LACPLVTEGKANVLTRTLEVECSSPRLGISKLRSCWINHKRDRGKAERMIGMESEIKIGQQFEFALHADKGLRQKAVVTRVLSNREEGLGPEADYYIAD